MFDSYALRVILLLLSVMFYSQNVAAESSGSDMVTKSDASAWLYKTFIGTDQNDPMKVEIVTCFVNSWSDEIFGTGVSELDQSTVKERFGEASKDLVELLMMKCVINSNAFAEDVKRSAGKNKKIPEQLAITDIDDVKIDGALLDGKKIRVKGLGFYMMNMFMLKKDLADMSPVFVDISKLPRELKKQALKQCSDVIKGCRIMLTGTVGKITYQNGIIAENIEW